ncbi:MAG: hypothetical protein ACO1OC_03665 [Tuberibacillus sp.]
MTTIEKQLKAAPRNYGYVITVTVIVILLFGWSLTFVNLKSFDEKGLKIALSILTRSRKFARYATE